MVLQVNSSYLTHLQSFLVILTALSLTDNTDDTDNKT